jgi:hypothetical protein
VTASTQRLAEQQVTADLAAAVEQIHRVASRAHDPVVVVIGQGTIGRHLSRRDARAFGTTREREAVELPGRVLNAIAFEDMGFGRWARRQGGAIKVFYVQGRGTLLINLSREDGTWSIEPGSTDAERAEAAS